MRVAADAEFYSNNIHLSQPLTRYRMVPSTSGEQFFIEGPSGRLESLYELPGGGEPRGAAVVLHPHPLHGGTMHNKVAYALARAFTGLGFASLRFNFRGVEASEGVYDDARGELDDAMAALAWLRQRHASAPPWVAGFSFGAAVAIRAAVAGPVAGLVSVAPAVKRFASGLARLPQCPWLIIQGSEDELVTVDSTIEWVNSLEPGPELRVIDGAEHFFHGRLTLLREAVSEFVGAHVPGPKNG